MVEAADADVPPAGTSLAARKGMRAAPLPRCTVTGVTAVVSVPRVLGVPAAQPAAASSQKLCLVHPSSEQEVEGVWTCMCMCVCVFVCLCRCGVNAGHKHPTMGSLMLLLSLLLFHSLILCGVVSTNDRRWVVSLSFSHSLSLTLSRSLALSLTRSLTLCHVVPITDRK